MPLSDISGMAAHEEAATAEEIQRQTIKRRTDENGADHLSTLKAMQKLGET